MSATIEALYGRRSDSHYSDWVTVDQPMIDRFADATFDHQYIHVDPENAAASAFGGTIAHGFLTLSLLSHLRELTHSLAVPDMKTSENIRSTACASFNRCAQAAR
ncbi:MAG: MaoC/PaaZ C-terminal domain-containing protein [Sphingobium sp.]